jgi:UDP-GlcNAc:undecaprenyl-phosphate/decaprenyl-phosphate GlcNAc-1-phosphate transferase
MFENQLDLLSTFGAFITAFTVAFFATPSVIHIAKVKHLFDEPGERASHTTKIPTLGGFGIFAGLIFAISLFLPFASDVKLKFILGPLIVIFLVGAKDDIIPLSPGKKVLGQLLAASILVCLGDVRITNLHGIFGFDYIAPWLSMVISLFVFIALTNAVNLIDGINGLSGSIGCVVSLFFGTWFFMNGQVGLAVVAAALMGALIAFLKYNITPAKIFMGDTGSLTIGLLCSLFAISFMEASKVGSPVQIYSAPAVAIAVLIVPIFDTIRVFTTRILNGKSPFYPDRTHIHHLLLDLGYSHMRATYTLVLVNLGFIGLALLLQNIGTLLLTIVILGLSTILTAILVLAVRRRVRSIQLDDTMMQISQITSMQATSKSVISNESISMN